MRHLLILFLASVSVAVAQSPVMVRNLQSDWLVNNGEQYQPFSGKSHNAIYFSIAAREGVGDYIEIKGLKSFSVFLNNKFLFTGNQQVLFSVDSLRRTTGLATLSLAIFAPNLSPEKLSTKLVRYPLIVAANVQELKPVLFSRDFLLVAALVILALLISIIRLNPKLASDYFSVTKIFSLRESEDSQVYTRITNSSNFLFYGFSSLTIGFFLLILFNRVSDLKSTISVYNFSSGMYHWLIVSGIVALVLAAKMITVYLFSFLFNVSELAGLQFFNWIRLFFLAIGFSVALLVVSVLSNVQTQVWFSFFYYLAGFLMTSWVILAFFKIAAKTRLGVFHLFSYLCATEIIPSLIILKILYY
jgi:Domain of unknown function (DUF4271)